MSIISKMVLKYLRLNKKRTAIAVGSVILSVTLLMICTNVFVWGFSYMQEIEKITYGDWHARYYDLTKEQADDLTHRPEFASCELKEMGNGWQADVVMKIVDGTVFQQTQEIGKSIGISDYDISYHIDLLGFYGVQDDDQQEMSMRTLLWMLLGMIMGITALLIYSIFSLSFVEKKKYAGLLSCIGASRVQRILFILEEAVIIGIISVPIGVLVGVAGSFLLINSLGDYLEKMWNFGVELPFTMDYKMILLVASLGMCTVFLAILVPTLQAMRGNALELVYNAGETRPIESKMKYYLNFPVEFNIAVRNLMCNKRKAMKIMVFAAMSIVVAFNGYVQIQHMRGKYLLYDKREEHPLEAWVSVYSDDFEINEKLTEELEQMEWCEDVSYQSVLHMGATIIDDRYLAGDLNEFELLWWGGRNPMTLLKETGEEKFYGFETVVIGIEDEVFYEYLDKLELSNVELHEDLEYPVILDDYIPVKNAGEKYASFREVFHIPKTEDFRIRFGKYGDYFIFADSIACSEHEEIDLQVLDVTDRQAPVPIMPDAYIDGVYYLQGASYYLKAYMPYSAFQLFLQDESVKNVYGSRERKFDNPVVGEVENPVKSYVTFTRNPGVSEKQIVDELNLTMRKLGMRPYMTNYEEKYINDSQSWKYGNIDNLEREKFLSNATELLKRIFIAGGIVIVLFFALFSLINYILTSIQMRKRELSVLKSLGMDYLGLKKMLLYENGVLILSAAVAGTGLALIVLQDQFEKIKEGAATIEMHFPLGAFFVVILGVLFMTSMVSLFAVNKVKQVNIMDALKNENN